MKINKENIHALFDRLSEKTILIIGDVMLDDYITGSVSRISPEAPVPVLDIQSRNVCLGGAANVALNVLSMGAKAVLGSVIGKDRKSIEFLEILKRENLSAEGIIESENRIQTVKYRAIGNNTQLLRLDNEISTPLCEEDEKKFLLHLLQILNTQKIDAVIFEDYDKGVITPSIVREITSFAHEKSIPVTVDPKKRNFLCYTRNTIFKPNWKELKEGLSLCGKWNDKETLNAIHHFMREKQHKHLLLTLSHEGVLMCRLQNEHFTWKHIPAYMRNIADVSGAGDTVISIATLGLTLGIDMEDTTRLSNLAGGLVCEEIGIVVLNKQKFIEEVLSIY
ncbi:MAG: PfkB family carbohydrate kinase [Bacteroidales bacterium]|jgi:rfaE bifunctional protein kinase chain/domain|nr:PfkB family carbohydrate kinase [Bacteroidales bacterium]